MEPEEVAFRILNKSIDIAIQYMRNNIRTQMDTEGNVNGFVLLTALRHIETDLKVRATKDMYNENK
jgi:hypothetical protein